MLVDKVTEYIQDGCHHRAITKYLPSFTQLLVRWSAVNRWSSWCGVEEWRNECLFIVFVYRNGTSLAMLDKHSGMLCHNIFLLKIYFYSGIYLLSNEMPFSHRFVSLEKNLSVDCVNICTKCMYIQLFFLNEFELSVWLCVQLNSKAQSVICVSLNSPLLWWNKYLCSLMNFS